MTYGCEMSVSAYIWPSNWSLSELSLSICGNNYNGTPVRLLPDVQYFISSITVSTAGSALMMLLRDLLELSPLYIAAHFLKWQHGGAERREQTYHTASLDTLLFSTSPSHSSPPTKPRPVKLWRSRGRGSVGVSSCVCLRELVKSLEDHYCCWCMLIAFEWHLIRLLLSLQEAAALCINVLLIRRCSERWVNYLESCLFAGISSNRRWESSVLEKTWKIPTYVCHRQILFYMDMK